MDSLPPSIKVLESCVQVRNDFRYSRFGRASSSDEKRDQSLYALSRNRDFSKLSWDDIQELFGVDTLGETSEEAFRSLSKIRSGSDFLYELLLRREQIKLHGIFLLLEHCSPVLKDYLNSDAANSEDFFLFLAYVSKLSAKGDFDSWDFVSKVLEMNLCKDVPYLFPDEIIELSEDLCLEFLERPVDQWIALARQVLSCSKLDLARPARCLEVMWKLEVIQQQKLKDEMNLIRKALDICARRVVPAESSTEAALDTCVRRRVVPAKSSTEAVAFAGVEFIPEGTSGLQADGTIATEGKGFRDYWKDGDEALEKATEETN